MSERCYKCGSTVRTKRLLVATAFGNLICWNEAWHSGAASSEGERGEGDEMSERCPDCHKTNAENEALPNSSYCTHPFHSGAASVPAPTTQGANPKCTICDHPRGHHEEEPPHRCFYVPYSEMCDCPGFSSVKPVTQLGAPTTQPEAPAPTDPFSKGYVNRHGKAVSDACGDGAHSQCTQTFENCHCTARIGHTKPHAYLTPPSTAAPELQERVAALEQFKKSVDNAVTVAFLSMTDELGATDPREAIEHIRREFRDAEMNWQTRSRKSEAERVLENRK